MKDNPTQHPWTVSAARSPSGTAEPQLRLALGSSQRVLGKRSEATGQQVLWKRSEASRGLDVGSAGAGRSWDSAVPVGGEARFGETKRSRFCGNEVKSVGDWDVGSAGGRGGAGAPRSQWAAKRDLGKRSEATGQPVLWKRTEAIRGLGRRLRREAGRSWGSAVPVGGEARFVETKRSHRGYLGLRRYRGVPRHRGWKPVPLLRERSEPIGRSPAAGLATAALARHTKGAGRRFVWRFIS